MTLRSTLPRLFAAFTAVVAVGAAVAAEPLSARAAQQALQHGALAWDVREAGVLLPGAVRLDARALERWFADDDVQALQHAASAAGLDLSRDVIVYGEPGDRCAQAAAAALDRVATGRVHWLVGGVSEWQALGLQTQLQPAERLPVPQRLVARNTPAGTTAMADRARREALMAAPLPLAAAAQR